MSKQIAKRHEAKEIASKALEKFRSTLDQIESDGIEGMPYKITYKLEAYRNRSRDLDIILETF